MVGRDIPSHLLPSGGDSRGGFKRRVCGNVYLSDSPLLLDPQGLEFLGSRLCALGDLEALPRAPS